MMDLTNGDQISQSDWLKIPDNYLPFGGFDRGIVEGECSGNTIIYYL